MLYDLSVRDTNKCNMMRNIRKCAHVHNAQQSGDSRKKISLTEACVCSGDTTLVVTEFTVFAVEVGSDIFDVEDPCVIGILVASGVLRLSVVVGLAVGSKGFSIEDEVELGATVAIDVPLKTVVVTNVVVARFVDLDDDAAELVVERGGSRMVE